MPDFLHLRPRPGRDAGAAAVGDDRPRSSGGRWSYLWVFVTFTACSFAVFHIAWRAPGSPVIGACCDQPSTINLLRWTAFAVAHGHDPLIVHALHAPQGINLMWQPNGMPLLGALATPLQLLFGPIVTYNLLMTLALPVSGLAAYGALRRWVGGTAGPLVGAFLYGFSPFMFTHALGHLNILFVPIPPLALLAVTDLVAYRRWPWWVSGASIGALCTAQLLLSQEVLVGTVISSIVVVGVLAVGHRREALRCWRRIGAGLGVAASTFVVLGAWPVAVLLFGPDRLHGRFVTPISLDILNLFLPSVTGQFRPASSAYFNPWGWSQGEAVGYLGIVLVVVAVVVAMRKWRQEAVRVAAVGGLCMLVLSLGPSLTVAGINLEIWLPARLLLALPLMQNMLPIRLFVFVDLAAAVLLAVFVRNAFADRTMRAGRPEGRYEVRHPGRHQWNQRIGAALVVILALVPLMPSIHYEVYRYPTPKFFTTDAVDAIPPGGNVLVAPYPHGGGNDAAPMVWQAMAGFRFSMVGGYVFAPNADGLPGATIGGPSTQLTLALTAVADGVPLPPSRRHKPR